MIYHIPISDLCFYTVNFAVLPNFPDHHTVVLILYHPSLKLMTHNATIQRFFVENINYMYITNVKFNIYTKDNLVHWMHVFSSIWISCINLANYKIACVKRNQNPKGNYKIECGATRTSDKCQGRITCRRGVSILCWLVTPAESERMEGGIYHLLQQLDLKNQIMSRWQEQISCLCQLYMIRLFGSSYCRLVIIYLMNVHI
jgi:hypothetical protein